jgi:hypothetical protein
MLVDSVGLEIHFRFENDKLLLLTLGVWTGKVVLFEVVLEGRIVTIIVRLPGVSPITDEAPLVLHAAVVVELVVVVKAFAAKAAHRMALEAGLIGRAGLVIAATHVLLELAISEQLVLVRENLLITGTEIAHSFLVDRFDMAMEVWPAKPRKVAISIGTVVPQKENCVPNNVFVGVFDADIAVGRSEVLLGIVVEFLLGIIGEDHIRRRCLGQGSGQPDGTMNSVAP